MATTTAEPSACNLYTESQSTKSLHWFLIPAVSIMLLLCFMEKRKSFKLNILGGRPGTARPFGVLDESSNRWGIMFAFGSVTGNIILLTVKALSKELKLPIWTKIFLVYLQCLETSVICYPLFACMTTRHKLLGAVVGLLYSLGWCAFEMFKYVSELMCFTYIDKQNGLNITAYSLIRELPVLVCNFLVVLKFCLKLYKCLRKGIYRVRQEEQVKLCKPYHFTYVKCLLNKNSRNIVTDSFTWKQKIRHKLIRPIPGFRFPSAIMISSFMSGVMLFMFSITCISFMESIAKTTQSNTEYGDLIQAANVIATIITLLCGIRNIHVFLMNYRRDMLLLFKGDRSFIPSTVRTSSPNVYMARGMRFVGTSITGMVWGTIFCYLFVFLPLAMMFVVIRILHTGDMLGLIWEQFEWLVYPVCMITIFKLQTFLIGRFFIQPKVFDDDENRPLAVDNRNAYDVYSFFTIFLNASIGVFAFLKRILMGVFLGVFLIPRMDRSLFMRGYEANDKCYVNYIGMIIVDEAHNHPVMRVFCFIVKTEVENRRDRGPLRSAVENAVYGDMSFSEHPSFKIDDTRNSIAKRKWLLAYTLIRNPALVALRVRGCKAEYQHGTSSLTDIRCDDKTAIVDKGNSDGICGNLIRCFRTNKVEIQSRILINIMVFIVLLAGFVIYAGMSVIASRSS